MDSIDPKILIAIIAAGTALLSALISSIVSLYISRKSFSKETDKTAIGYLEKKIELLEKNKNKLWKFMNRTPDNQDPATVLAELTKGRFDLAKDVLREIEHYLNDGVRKKLSDDCEYANKTFAIEIAKEKGIIENEKESSLSGSQIIDQMHKFADNLSSALNTELIASVKGIEKLSDLKR